MTHGNDQTIIPDDMGDRTDRIANTWRRSTDHDVHDAVIARRLIRAAELIAPHLGDDPDTLDIASLPALEQALRLLHPMEKQDLERLLTAITIANGDLPGPPDLT